MVAGAAVAAGALLLALPPVPPHRTGGVAEDPPPAWRTVALPASRVTQRTVLALTLIPTVGHQINIRKKCSIAEPKIFNFGSGFGSTYLLLIFAPASSVCSPILPL